MNNLIAFSYGMTLVMEKFLKAYTQDRRSTRGVPERVNITDGSTKVILSSLRYPPNGACYRVRNGSNT